ncbi:MAG: metallophosphoesterase [Treponema sp.]|jgi:putative phosphoesterase|nr:metallophosphoesterase [Treponema sp.]
MKNPSLLVVSDTHGHKGSLIAVLRWAQRYRQADALVFLGDGAGDLSQALAQTGFAAPWKAVKGNGDYDAPFPPFDTLDFAGRRFFLTHGHLHSLLEGFDFLAASAKSHGAGAALFGHTHIPFWEEYGGLLLLNPGSLGRPRSSHGPSFAVIECPENEWFKIHYWSLREGPLGKTIREMDL